MQTFRLRAPRWALLLDTPPPACMPPSEEIPNRCCALQMVENAPVWPENVPMYDFQGQAPFLYELSNPVFEHYKRMKAADPKGFDELLASGSVTDPPPREGSAKILQWELNIVSHPASVRCPCCEDETLHMSQRM